jgi:high affinity Mn2+ porin
LPATGTESWNVHGQFTVVTQRHGVFAAGGMGILIGDGQLSHYAREQILELYYAVNLNKTLTVSGDLQYVKNPAYNADRGPVSIAGLRLHAEF